MSGTDTQQEKASRVAGEQAKASSGRRRPIAASSGSKSAYLPAVDGLRALAVLAVIFYHMGFSWSPGGLLGVTVFFVISGFLITRLLFTEFGRTGTIDLKSFWLRRARRLLPAVVLVIVVVAALCTVFDPVLLDKMRPDIMPSLLFFNNWWQVFHEVSYFEAQGAPSPLQHFWSLGIEEQFYLIWPVLLLVLLTWGIRRPTMRKFALILAGLSALEMFLLYDPYADPSRIYYGTDTRAFALLIGAWLAFAYPSISRLLSKGGHKEATVTIVGALCLVGLLLLMAFTNGYSAFPYKGGLLLCSVLSAGLMLALVMPGNFVANLFASAPMVWIGKRSYGLYLWHFPLLLLTTNQNATQDAPWWLAVVQLALIFSVAALSFTFVEDPIRRGRLGQWFKRVREAKGLNAQTGPRHGSEESGYAPRRGGLLKPGYAVATGAFCAAAVVAAVGLAITPDVAKTAYDVSGASSITQAQQARNTAAFGDEAQSGVAPEAVPAAGAALDGEGAGGSAHDAATGDQTSQQGADATGDSAGSSDEATADGEGGADEQAVSDKPEDPVETVEELLATPRKNDAGLPIYEPLLIGDSVSAGCIDQFYAAFPNGCIDAQVSRNIWESTYPMYADADQVGQIVVFCLGTNNGVEPWQIDDELLAPVPEDKTVIMVNTRNTLDYCQATNEVIAATPERHPNVKVVDWYSYSEGHDEWFAGDGTHLNAEGAQAYIDLIRQAILEA